MTELAFMAVPEPNYDIIITIVRAFLFDNHISESYIPSEFPLLFVKLNGSNSILCLNINEY